ncbi:MAG: polyprenyl synthetase family protein [Bacteroidaceae bacterium]|nr:polyprenyl synthetase family protein [Bacteroidaceae bacterium]
MLYSPDEIRERFETFFQSLDYSHEPDTLYEPVRYILSPGGKRIRPVLLLLATGMFSDEMENSLRAAAGIEILHNFSLLHDDLMDNADMRRGIPTVHKRWNRNSAILAGDVMSMIAPRYLSDIEGENRKQVMDLVLDTFIGVFDGQQYDMDFETRNDVTSEEYIEMIRLKTSIVLAACLKAGALLGGASESDASLLYRFGEKVGLAFQLQDDLLDVYGDPAVFGKKIGGDILCNKKTYLYISARARANAAMHEELDRWALYDGPDPQSKIDGVKAVYDALRVREQSESLIGALFAEAMAVLGEVSAPAERKTVLKEYVNSLMNRGK